jgi:hypothetical protein
VTALDDMPDIPAFLRRAAPMSPQELLNKHGITLASYEPGQHYATCPQCSAKRQPKNRSVKCLGVKIESGERACWHCCHCEWSGPEKGSGGSNGRGDGFVATYDYCLDGVVQFQKVRNPPGSNQRFWIRRPDGNGGWINGAGDADTTILYRIDEVRSAIKAGQPIALVEGEKDTNNLWALGIPATCNAHGAHDPTKKQKPKWKKVHSEQLRGADIIVFNDNDAAGYEHADVVCKLSLGIAKRVRRLDLKPHWTDIPKGGDVSDWLAAGHTREELDKLIADAPVIEIKGAPKIGRDEGAALLNQVSAFLSRFIVYPSEHAQIAHVLWIAHAHLMAAWESTPRIAFLSPEPESGKTRSMEVSELLVPNSVAAVNVTPAYLFRKVGGEDGPPTVLFDEIDTVFGPKAKENEELRALLNSGHRRGATAGRCVVRGKIVETEEISSYAAVALAGLGWLPETILSRSIIIRMRRRARDEKIEPFRRRVHAPIGEALRRRLAAWAATIFDEATEARPDMPQDVEDRSADMWEPLLAVADIAGGDWPKLGREAARALVAVARDVEPSLNIRLLGDLRMVFEAEDKAQRGQVTQLSTKLILAKLHALEDAPWGDLKGKPLSDNQLGRRLKQYGIKSKTLRLDGGGFAKGYAREDFYDAWRRYLPPSPPSDKPVTSVTPVTEPDLWGLSVTPVTAQGSNVTPPVTACDGSGNAQNAHEMRVVTPVTPVTPLSGNAGRSALTARPKSDDLPYTGPVVAPPDLGPDDSLDEHDTPRQPQPANGEPPLSRWQVRDLAGWYTESFRERQQAGGLDEKALKAELRQRIADEGVPPERIESAFKQVMDAVFRV